MIKTKLRMLLGCFFIFSACSFPFSTVSKADKTPQNEEKSFDIGEILHIQPALTPTPTPIPASRLKEADDAYFAGDLDLAQQLYQQAYDQAKEIDIKSNAMLGLGKAY